MATGGCGNLNIVEEGIDDLSISGKRKSVNFKHPDPTKIEYFFKDKLKSIAETGASVSRNPKVPKADEIDEFIIEFDVNNKEADKAIKDLSKAICDLDSDEITIPDDKVEEIDKLKSIEKDILFIHDDTDRKVTIFGRDYGNVKKVAHKIKLNVGLINITKRFKGEEIISTPSSGKTNKDYRRASRQSQDVRDYGEEFSCEYELTGLTVKIYKANITRLKVDVIVNAANENMMHGGGVARVISDAAGYKLNKESQDYVERNGPLSAGENIVTSPGKMQYDSVIHAVGPVWYDYRDKVECLDMLYDCVWNILTRCHEKKFRTVAMPAISSGIFGVPKELCADMYIAAVTNFAKKKSSGSFKYPDELHIIDIDVNILKLVKSSMEKWKKEPKAVEPKESFRKYQKDNPRFSGNNYNTGNSGSNRPRNTRHASHGSNVVNTRSPSVEDLSDWNLKDTCMSVFKKLPKETFRWGGTAELYRVDSEDCTITVKIFEGDMTKPKVDAIVCGIDKNLNASGFIADALKKIGGPTFRSKFQKMVTNNQSRAKLSDVYKCGGGNLKAGHVMYVVSGKVLNANEKDVETYNEAIQNVIDKANEWKFTSIVLPLFGTGSIDTNKDKLKKCAVALLTAIDATVGDSKSLKEILLINKSSRVNEVLTEVFDEVSSTGKGGKHGASFNRDKKPRGKSPTQQNADDDGDESSPERDHSKWKNSGGKGYQKKGKGRGQRFGTNDNNDDDSDVSDKGHKPSSPNRQHNQRSSLDDKDNKYKSESVRGDKMNKKGVDNSKFARNVTDTGVSGLGNTIEDDDDGDDNESNRASPAVIGNLNIFES